ncbi:MAG: DMT family transporter [Ilumatobacteraceae bacterium]
MNESDRRFGPPEWAMSTVIAVIWGSSFLWIAIAIDHVDVTVVPLARCLFGVGALGLFAPARVRVDRRDQRRFAFLGLCWMAIPFLLYPIAEQTVSTSITGMLNGGLPIVTAVVTAVFTRVVPSAFRIAAVAVGGTGIVLISLASIGDDDGGGANAAADGKGIMLLLIALVCYAIAANVARPMQAKYGALATMLWITGYGVVWSLPLGLNGIRHSDFTWTAIGALVALGAVGTGVAFAFYGVLLHRAGPVRGMIGIFFTPIVGTILGIAFRDDELHGAAIAGMGIVILGAMMTSRPEPAAASPSAVRSRPGTRLRIFGRSAD